MPTSITITLDGDGEASNGQLFRRLQRLRQRRFGRQGLIWIEGYDLAGNPIDGGGPGFDNDQVTYVSMTSKTPVIRNFFIEDSRGNGFLNSNELQDGTWNQTMYAGNVYHPILEAGDDNGWRDVDFFTNLDKTTDAEGKVQDMNIWYYLEIKPLGPTARTLKSWTMAWLVHPCSP